MQTALRCMAMLGIMTVATASMTIATAQDKSKSTKQAKAGKTTGIVEMNEGKDGKFRLVIRDNDEKYLATSAAFATKEDAEKGLESLKSALENPKMTSKKATPKTKAKAKDEDKSVE